ncbi:Uncharacterised protein [uncultured archaeon]|nr:Uncharacterised protein [uncultured archaeon]
MANGAKGFIFSIDAFVAFTLVLVVLHSLIFLAAVPSSYYAGLTQANYLARDTLNTLTYADAALVLNDTTLDGISLMHYIIMTKDVGNLEAIRAYVGALIPDQYGYTLEFRDSAAGSWSLLYDTKDYADDPHNKLYNKLKASSYSIFFGYTDAGRDPKSSPYCYITCNGPGCPTQCDKPKSFYEAGHAALGLVRLTVYR